MSFLDKPSLSADNGSFFQKNVVYQTEKPTLSEINLLYLIIVTTACHIAIYALLRLNLSISKARCQCYDGASAMRSARFSVIKQIRDMEERATYTHYHGHALNLACSDTIKTIKLRGDSLNTSRKIKSL